MVGVKWKAVPVLNVTLVGETVTVILPAGGSALKVMGAVELGRGGVCVGAPARRWVNPMTIIHGKRRNIARVILGDVFKVKH